MNFNDLGTWASIVGLIVAVFGLFFGARYLINKSKNIGGDDHSIKIGKKNKIKNSFNREK